VISANSKWSRHPRYQSADDGAAGSDSARGAYGRNSPFWKRWISFVVGDWTAS
jgi:hypothetical protein